MSKPSSREHREGRETSLSADELQRELEEDLKFNLTTTDEDVSFISDTKLNMTSEKTLSRFPFHQFCWRRIKKARTFYKKYHCSNLYNCLTFLLLLSVAIQRIRDTLLAYFRHPSLRDVTFFIFQNISIFLALNSLKWEIIVLKELENVT
jgi:hypothetical protein